MEEDMPEQANEIYLIQTKDKAVFALDGPKPQFLVDTPHFKVLVAGLEPGQQIPPHPDVTAMYYFLEGSGLITVGDESFAIQPGVTVIAPDGAPRGMNAKTRVIFLGAKAT
jgi:mannose-6-phosphate isomerase-like protein (cupin superfamily)